MTENTHIENRIKDIQGRLTKLSENRFTGLGVGKWLPQHYILTPAHSSQIKDRAAPELLSIDRIEHKKIEGLQRIFKNKITLEANIDKAVETYLKDEKESLEALIISLQGAFKAPLPADPTALKHFCNNLYLAEVSFRLTPALCFRLSLVMITALNSLLEEKLDQTSDMEEWFDKNLSKIEELITRIEEVFKIYSDEFLPMKEKLRAAKEITIETPLKDERLKALTIKRKESSGTLTRLLDPSIVPAKEQAETNKRKSVNFINPISEVVEQPFIEPKSLVLTEQATEIYGSFMAALGDLVAKMEELEEKSKTDKDYLEIAPLATQLKEDLYEKANQFFIKGKITDKKEFISQCRTLAKDAMAGEFSKHRGYREAIYNFLKFCTICISTLFMSKETDSVTKLSLFTSKIDVIETSLETVTDIFMPVTV